MCCIVRLLCADPSATLLPDGSVCPGPLSLPWSSFRRLLETSATALLTTGAVMSNFSGPQGT